MQKILESSIVYRFLAAIGVRFGRQWKKSRIIAWFVSPGWNSDMSEGSVFTRAWRGFHRALCLVFEKLRINKLLRGSILTMPFIWCVAAAALAPIVPTMAVLAITLVCIISLLLAFGCNRERALTYSPMNKYVIMFALVYMVATFTSVDVSGSLLGGALTTLFLLFSIVIQNSVATKRQLDILIYTFVVSGVAVSLYGIYQYAFGAVNAAAWVDSSMFSELGVRVYSTLDNPNVLAMYLLLVIPFAGASILNVKKPLARLFFIGCVGILLVCMLLTFSRGGWLGLIIAAAIFLVMHDRRFIILGIVGLIVLYFALPDVILDRLLSIGNIEDSSTSFRVFIWLGSINMLRDYWFTGIGPGVAAFNRVYPLYSYNTVTSPHSHNLYLQVMCEAGICGIVLFIVVLFTYFRELCTAVAREGDKTSKTLQIAAISSVFGFLIQGMTDHSFYNYRVTFVFWLALGVGMLVSRRSALQGAEGKAAPPASDAV